MHFKEITRPVVMHWSIISQFKKYTFKTSKIKNITYKTYIDIGDGMKKVCLSYFQATHSEYMYTVGRLFSILELWEHCWSVP